MSDYTSPWEKSNTSLPPFIAEHVSPGTWLDSDIIYNRHHISTIPLLGPYHEHFYAAGRAKQPFVSTSKYRGNVPRLLVENFAPRCTPGILMGENNLCVVDIDTNQIDILSAALDAFGQTKALVHTKRGTHLYYKAPYSLQPRSQSTSSYYTDLKAGLGAYTVAPFSPYDRSGFYYTWANCPTSEEWQDQLIAFCNSLVNAPFLDLSGVSIFWPDKKATSEKVKRKSQPAPGLKTSRAIKPRPSAKTKMVTSEAHKKIMEGARNDTLFKFALKEAIACQTKDQLSECLLLINSRKCVQPLSDAEINGIVKSAWGYEKNGKNIVRRKMPTKPNQPVNITPKFWELLRAHPQEYQIITRLLQYHKSSSVFPLAIKWMETEFNWSASTVKKIRKNLVKLQLLVQVSSANKSQNLAARYRFSNRLMATFDVTSA